MQKIYLALAFVSAFLLPAQINAQEVGIGTIAKICQESVESEAIDASCAAAVDGFIAIVSTEQASAPLAIGNLVTVLSSGELELQAVCNRVANQVAKLGSATPDREQGSLIQDISETLAICEPTQTALIAPLSVSLF